MAMIVKKDLSSNVIGEGDDNSGSKLTRSMSIRFQEGQDEKMSFLAKGTDLHREETLQLDGLPSSRPSKTRNSRLQELTLSYLCDNPKLAFPEREFSGKTQVEKVSQKGKEVVPDSEIPGQDEKWVEHDFLNLTKIRRNSSKREAEEKVENKGNVGGEKKAKLEALNLSLALPDVSLSLTASNALQNGDLRIKPEPGKVGQSLPPATDTNTTYSNDFTSASAPYSYSRSYSHNPSCSRARNSTENYDFSVGKDDRIWCAGEGTNGSVHSSFRPLGDGVSLANPGGNGGALSSMVPSILPTDKDSLNRNTSSGNNSFFPSELPARPCLDNQSVDSMKQDSEDVIVLGSTDRRRNRKSSRVQRIAHEIVSESIPAMGQIVQNLPLETLQSIREYLRNLIEMSDKKEELAALQKKLESRSDLTKETLLKCHKDQIEILVAVKMGLKRFLSGKIRLHTAELVEVFLFERCRNLNCNQFLPIDDCDCKICSEKRGFCSSCMCPVCLMFDCASNTCTWVGCDVCSHWCHAACGIEKNLIKPGPSLKGPSGTTDMQFHCLGCGHASEMFGFVKDVFLCCAKDWGLETLFKELNCVKKIFRGSDDLRGRQLCVTADELLSKLQKKLISVSDACNIIFGIFNCTDYILDFSVSGASTKDVKTAQADLGRDEASVMPPKYPVHKIASSGGQSEIASTDLHQRELKATVLGDLKVCEEYQAGRLSKNDRFESLGRMVRIKEAEARMFQNKADEAHREAESLKKMIQARIKILDEEYAEKLAKLSVHETEERRRKRLEELKALENSQCDYYKMKVKMQTEIAGLLERMEATKQKLV